MLSIGPLSAEPVSGPPSCLLTIDVEDWFHANYSSLPRGFQTEGLPRRVESGVAILLDRLASVGARATFFVLGVVAEEHPTLVPRIAKAGHEIACHGWRHSLIYEQQPSELREELGRARDVLRDQSGQPVLGFRAPSWSITEASLWALDVLLDVGFLYDSSIFPGANYLYGIDGAPSHPTRVRTQAGATLLEIPPATVGWGSVRLGVAGGFYLRALPYAVHRWAMADSRRRGVPFVAYTHPREIDPESWRLSLPLSLKERVISEAGLRLGRARLDALLEEAVWQPIADWVDRRPIDEVITADRLARRR